MYGTTEVGPSWPPSEVDLAVGGYYDQTTVEGKARYAAAMVQEARVAGKTEETVKVMVGNEGLFPVQTWAEHELKAGIAMAEAGLAALEAKAAKLPLLTWLRKMRDEEFRRSTKRPGGPKPVDPSAA